MDTNPSVTNTPLHMEITTTDKSSSFEINENLAYDTASLIK